jgi:hypothetical protein
MLEGLRTLGLVLMLELIALLLVIFLSFAFGYGIRELISRRRRAAARKRLRGNA